MNPDLKMPTDPFGPPLRHLSVADYESWLLDFAWPMVAHIDRDKTSHDYGEPFTFFPEEKK